MSGSEEGAGAPARAQAPGAGAAAGAATKREVFGWCMFDFANSSYTTVISTVAFSAYFTSTICVGGGLSEGEGNFLWGLAQTISQALVVLTAPVVGAIADFTRGKKGFLLFTWFACVLATACLGLADRGDVFLGLAIFIISNLFYSSGENIVAAFLPEIAPPERMGRVSGMAWALGYVGGLGSLLLCQPLLAGGFGPENATNLKWAFVLVAGFFFCGGLPTFLFLRERAAGQRLPAGRGYIGVGFSRVFETLSRIRQYRQLFFFLIVFLVYNCGITIVVNFASIYARGEVKMSGKEIVTFFMIVQLSASLGALLFGFLQDRIGSKRAIQLSLVLWLVACVGAFASRSAGVFYIVGNVAGMAMGAAQSGGRALVGLFSPVERSGEFFGFWGLFWKLSAAIGPLTFGAASRWIGMRAAILLTAAYFAAGIAGMFFIDEEAGRRAARSQELTGAGERGTG